MTILDEILEEKRKRLPSLRAEIPPTPATQRKRLRLSDAFDSMEGLGVVAEVKRASPSKGIINADADPASQALRYERAGASCISVLTEEAFFKGSYEDLAAVAEAVRIPVLCKDFIIDELQIDRAHQAGASVVLLIVAALPQDRLRELHAYAGAAGLDILVEVHGEKEMDRALELEPEFIGINNRDLKTFKVDLGNTARLASRAGKKPGRYLISESGIMSADDAARVRENGADAILVGESLMRSGDPGAAIRSYREAEGVLRP